jgi:hypothetical protein
MKKAVRSGAHFLYFLGAPMILLYNAKSVILMVNVSLRGLINVSGVNLVQVLLASYCSTSIKKKINKPGPALIQA